ncbi:MAG: hypothetical protein JST00_44425 [Deltaproteobacteria bacterium]|nr:hypothetical protein [Deltaproteobacteria bacterium]
MGVRASVVAVASCAFPAVVAGACTLTTDLTGLSGGTSSGGASSSGGVDGGRVAEGGTSEGGRPGCVDKTSKKRGGVVVLVPGAAATWSDPEGALAADDRSVAEARIASGLQASPLLVRQFGFAIPSGAVVKGVTATVRKRGDEELRDDTVRLQVAGVPAGQDRKLPGGWKIGFSTSTYGGPADRWGLDLTPDVVNGETFGLAFNARHEGAGNSLAEVDEVALEVTYCE